MFTRAGVLDDDKDEKKAARREIAKRTRCKLRIYAIVPERRSRTTRRALETGAKRRMESDITPWIEKRRYLTPETRRMQKRFEFLAILSSFDHKRYLVFVTRQASTSWKVVTSNSACAVAANCYYRCRRSRLAVAAAATTAAALLPLPLPLPLLLLLLHCCRCCYCCYIAAAAAATTAAALLPLPLPLPLLLLLLLLHCCRCCIAAAAAAVGAAIVAATMHLRIAIRFYRSSIAGWDFHQ